MTKFYFSSLLPRLSSTSALANRSVLVSALILAGLSLAGVAVQAQGLKLSQQFGSSPVVSGPAANVQRSADFIVAVVNSEPITNTEVRIKLLRAEQQLSQQGAPIPPRSELLPQVLERLISDKAQLQLARLSGLKVDENAVENAVESVARQNQISVDELRRRLEVDGIAYSQFRNELRDEVLVSRLRQREVDSRAVIADQDIDQYLRDQALSGSLEINLAQILVSVPENATPTQVAAFQAKAQSAADSARAGANFAALVGQYSDAQTANNGGQIGLRSADRYPSLFVDATQRLAVGGIAGPIRSGAGFHVLKLIEKKQGNAAAVNVTQTHARHILLRLTPQFTEAMAQAKLADYKRRVLSGQSDFAQLARDNSEDASAKDGGDLGWASPGMFVPEFEQAMNGLALNQISEPLVSRFGVHLIQVLERREAKLTARELRETARNVLRDKKQEEAYALWAQEVRGRAYVEYRDSPK
ncbi:Chaperone SurA [Polaromonas vacuolata]|uniref:Chaperone SurA n=1 Tax=Polaromonas vacuolata TaxID=37448 RepID=A0A6H2HE59_9BURK|nr:peptidylprolyl isomerase [Polaromonas vacuolata]QJC58179.1 Chaperone SurA [Polaromonas vacuolata]